MAPELAPMLASIEMPANFVPLTNAVMAEMARRGVGRQQILTTLHKLGQELPEASVNMIKVSDPCAAIASCGAGEVNDLSKAHVTAQFGLVA